MQQPASAGKAHQNGYKMKRVLLMLCLLTGVFSVSAQSDRYEQKYDLLVSQLGPDGVGIETVLNNWAKVDSLNPKMLQGRFNYYFTKAQSTEVVARTSRKYLGMEPILTLKDTTGADIYYYQVSVFDDGLYGEAVKAADKAMNAWPDRIDFRFMKANAYIAYEKESPDMALAYLMKLVDENRVRKPEWVYGEEKVDEDFFQEAMQEYCYSFFTIGSPASYDAFYKLSEKLSGLYPDNAGFINNLGSYYLIAKEDYKSAFKYYNKVLKKHPDDYTAIRNSALAARKQGNVKLEKKYLEMLMKYGSEQEQLQAKGRLEVLKK